MMYDPARSAVLLPSHIYKKLPCKWARLACSAQVQRTGILFLQSRKGSCHKSAVCSLHGLPLDGNSVSHCDSLYMLLRGKLLQQQLYMQIAADVFTFAPFACEYASVLPGNSCLLP